MSQIIALIAAFIARKMMLIAIGVYGLGLDGLFLNLLSILNIAEMGIGAAIAYHLYPAVVKEDEPPLLEDVGILEKFHKGTV